MRFVRWYNWIIIFNPNTKLSKYLQHPHQKNVQKMLTITNQLQRKLHLSLKTLTSTLSRYAQSVKFKALSKKVLNESIQRRSSWVMNWKYAHSIFILYSKCENLKKIFSPFLIWKKEKQLKLQKHWAGHCQGFELMQKHVSFNISKPKKADNQSWRVREATRKTLLCAPVTSYVPLPSNTRALIICSDFNHRINDKSNSKILADTIKRP